MQVFLIGIALIVGVIIGYFFAKKSNNGSKEEVELAIKLEETEALLQQQKTENTILETTQKHHIEQYEKNRVEINLYNQKFSVLNEQLMKLKPQLSTEEEKNRGLSGDVSRLNNELGELKNQYLALGKKLEGETQTHSQAQAEISKLKKHIEASEQSSKEKIELLEGAKKSLADQFENLANRIFDEKGQQNKVNLVEILQPFKSDMDGFKKKIDDVYGSESMQRASLQKEVQMLHQMNQEMNQEAKNLTKALKGDKKLQGDWGEVVLERVLESSGLRKDHEYKVQISYTKLDEDEQKKTFRPDVIVSLPDGKDVIIDAKVSLVSYDAYTRSETESERAAHLKKHIEAIRQHVQLLSSKSYESLDGINSLDFILMFMPIEAAFVLAFQQDENLFHEAFRQKIIIVTPTTLLATLGTIKNTWKYESLNKNAAEITQRAARMLDKFRGVIEDIEDVGKAIEKSREHYNRAFDRLTKGRGNVISQAVQLENLGASMKKPFPRATLEQAELELRSEDK